MDHYARIGLVVAWGGFILAILIWWVRRRGSRQYPYSERANIILDAIQQRVDLGIVYWSKSEKKFLRRVITPESLDGYALRAYDHKAGEVRVFKVTRIRLINPIAPGEPKRPPPLTTLIAWPTVAAFALGILAVALLAFALFRSHGPEHLTILPPPLDEPNKPMTVSSVSASGALKMATQNLENSGTLTIPGETIPKASAPGDSVVDDVLNTPPPVTSTNRSWYLIVENHSSYKVRQVSEVLEGVFRYRPDRAIELEQSVHTIGRAVVWMGPKERAERYQQLLEGYDLSVVIERAGGASTTNAAAAATNAVPPATP